MHTRCMHITLHIPIYISVQKQLHQALLFGIHDIVKPNNDITKNQEYSKRNFLNVILTSVVWFMEDTCGVWYYTVQT